MKKNILFIAYLFAGTAALAQNWTGAVSSDWNNAANWSATPGNGDDIVIDPANYTGAMAQPLVSGTSNFTPAEMVVQNGAELTITGSLAASDRVEVLGDGTSVTIAGGTFSLTGGGNNARLVFAEDAHLQLESGILNVGQRLLFELGGSGEINGGNVTVGETIALVDGSALASSLLVQNGGSITANAEFGFENEAGVFFPAFVQTGGELHVNGALLWLGAAPGAGRGYFRSTGGEVYVTGTIGNDPTSTMGMHLELRGATTFLENAGNSVQLLAGDSVVVADSARWLDLNTVAWQNAGAFHSETDGLFRFGNSVLNGAGTYQFDNTEIPSGKTGTHVSPASIAVSGNMNVTGTFVHNTNRLVLNGAQAQTLQATAAGFNLYDLEVAHSGSGVALNSSVSISHNIHFADGIVTTVSPAVIRVADNATITGGADTAFVDGYIEKTGDDAVFFPLGAAPDRYRPLEISAPASAATVVRAGYVFDAYTSVTPVETPLQTVSALEYWDLSRTGSTDVFAVTAGWNDASQSGLTDCADIALTVWDGTEWRFVAATPSGLCAGENAGTLAAAADLPVIGPLTIGFTDNVYQQIVELCPNATLTVGDSTYSEPGVYITVLQDANGGDSTVVSVLHFLDPITVTVTDNITYIAAVSALATNYQWIDCGNGNQPVAGATSAEFYPADNGSYAVIVTRTDCPDADTSVCIAIDQLGLGETALAAVVLYPNPVSGNGVVTLKASAAIATVVVVTADGKTLRPETTAVGEKAVSVQLPGLPAGWYSVSIHCADGSVAQQRLVVY